MLKIRLRQQGRKNRQTYRLVVTDIRNPRDGKYLEMIGWYNPFSNTNDSQLNIERINYWVGLRSGDHFKCTNSDCPHCS